MLEALRGGSRRCRTSSDASAGKGGTLRRRAAAAGRDRRDVRGMGDDFDAHPGGPAAPAPGRLLVVVHPTRSNLRRHTRPGPRHLLGDGELPGLARGLEALRYEEDWTVQVRHEARLVARSRSATRRVGRWPCSLPGLLGVALTALVTAHGGGAWTDRPRI
jgi:hypothetical protein